MNREPVEFQLEADKPAVIFKYNVKSVIDMERAGGTNPAFLAASGKQVSALITMFQFARTHDDPTMNEAKAQKAIQRYLDNGGRTKPLMDALVLALNRSQVYGRNDDDGDDAEPGANSDDE